MTRRANVDGWLRLFKDRQFDPSLAEQWARLARPAIRLIQPETLFEDDLPPGCSKLGGEPDLPVGMGWPIRPAYRDPEQMPIPEIAREESPLHFLAQFNLRDIASAGCDLPLPASGLLLFFYDADVQPWGTYPDDATGWRVIYVDDETETERVSSPFEPCPVQAIQLEPSENLPDSDWMKETLRDKRFSAEEDKLTEVDSERMYSYSHHSFGGWPSPVQFPPEFDCELVGKGDGIKISDILEEAAEWRLLLQIHSDDDLFWSWGGGGGMIYFLCRESDIASQRFDRVWVILQCG